VSSGTLNSTLYYHKRTFSFASRGQLEDLKCRTTICVSVNARWGSLQRSRRSHKWRGRACCHTNHSSWHENIRRLR